MSMGGRNAKNSLFLFCKIPILSLLHLSYYLITEQYYYV